MIGPSRAGLQLGLILASALAVRLLFAAFWQDRLPEGSRFGFGDSESYWQLGLALAAGEPYQYGSPERRVFRGPGYPLLLAGLFRCVGPSVAAARVLSTVLSTLAVVALYAIGRNLFDGRTGRVAATLAAFSPEAIAAGGWILSEAPFALLMLVQLGCWQTALRRESASWRVRFGWLVATGMVGGAASLVRPSWLLFTPLAAVVLAALSRPEGQDGLGDEPLRRTVSSARAASSRLLGPLVVCSAMILVMSPWWIRNAMVTGQFVPTTLQVGASLYDGLNPQATGASRWEAVDARAEPLRQELFRQNVPPSSIEYRLDRALRGEALAWAWEHPSALLTLGVVKFFRTWNVWPNDPAFRSLPIGVVLCAGFAPLLVLGLAGTWRNAGRGAAFWMCVLPAVYISLLHVVFVGSIRYRGPAMLALCVPAAAWLCDVCGSWFVGRGKVQMTAGFLTAIVSYSVQVTVHSPEGLDAAIWRVSPPPTPPHNVADLHGPVTAKSFAATLWGGGHLPARERLPHLLVSGRGACFPIG